MCLHVLIKVIRDSQAYLPITLKIAKTGALCCVAAGPHGVKPNTETRNHSMVPDEPQWQTNSSFSPPPRRWDCRFQSDGLHHGYHRAPLSGSSLYSNSKQSRGRVKRDQYPSHHHSMSDGVVSYIRSPPDNFHPPRWTPPVPELKSDGFSTPVGESRSTSLLTFSTERQFNTGASGTDRFGSPSFSECGQWESTSKKPSSSHRNLSGRRSFRSKPVYPLVFCNPISDSEAVGFASTSSISNLIPAESTPSHWPCNNSHKFHKTIMELQKMEASPDPSMSSRREGFRWSNASSFDLGLDGENFDAVQNVDVERSPKYHTEDHMCGFCSKFLRQRSPWSSYRIVRGSDMPIAGVLSCGHVFHAECLEQATPKTQVHDPPCPVCSKTMGVLEDSPSVSEPLQVALRSVQRNQGIVISDTSGMDDIDQTHQKRNTLKNRPNSMKSHFRKPFSFKGKSGKDIFRTKMFRRFTSSSSNHDPGGSSKSAGHSRK